MKREHHLVNNLCFIVTFIKITSGEICYGAEFSEDVVGCPDFENEYLICDTLRLGMVEGKEAELGLNGVIEVFSDIDEGAEVKKAEEIINYTYTKMQIRNVVNTKLKS
ncbi:uncharacterized protein [Choristoneura fumiferana]|uniref:uncharacterized protein n=1 Tax=Choristoneura fumiferana TaxID=7141 RepID=UPI003D1566AA